MSTASLSNPASAKAALQQLRAQAEQRRHLVTQSVADKSPEEVQRLVQELQVHQIELEMQYEELLLAQAEVEAVRAEYVSLYEFAPAGYFTLDAPGQISQLNLSGARLLGTVRQHLLGRRFALFIAPPHRGKFAAFLAGVLSADHRQTCELEMLRDDGTPFFAQIEGVAVAGAGGAPPSQCRLAIVDTTARYQTSQALAASEARFRQLFEQSSDAVLLVQHNVVIDCNRAALTILGTTCKQQLVGHHPWHYAAPLHASGRPSADQFILAVADAVQKGSRRGEFVLHRLSGEARWIESVLTPIAMNGELLVHIVWRDITAVKQAAEQLQASEAQLSLALTASGTGTFNWDFASAQVQLDQRAQAAFGHPVGAEQAAKGALLESFHPNDVARVRAAVQAAVLSRELLVLEYRVMWPDGSIHYLASAGRVVLDAQNQACGFAGVVRDVTAQHEAEEDRSYKTMLVQRMLETMPVVLAHIQPDGHYRDAVGQGLRNVGFSSEALVGVNALQAFPEVRDKLERLLAGEPLEFDNSIEYQGQRYYFHNYGFFDQQRQQATVLGIDVTEAEEQKKRLRAAKEFSESLLDNSVDGIMAFDQQGRFLAWNRVLEQHTGRPAAELLGCHVFAAFPEWEHCAPGRAIRQVLKGKRLMRYNMSFHNQPGYYEAYLVPLLGASSAVDGGLILIRDVTQRVQQAEEATRLKLRQQQEVLSAILTTQEEERKRIAEALHNGVGQLLYAAKLNLENHKGAPSIHRSTVLDLLNEAIKATRTISFELTPGILEDFGLKIALDELGKRIPQHNLRTHFNLVGMDKPRPRLIEIAIYRVVQELLNNIIKHAQASEVFVHVVHEGLHVHISVEDNGIGMSPEQATGPLKGIGLAGIRNRIDLLGGELKVESRVGRGTIVTIELTMNL